MKISVVVPVYNAEPYLEKCLNSVVAQSYARWEVVAIDDGSQDESLSVLRRFAERDERFKIETKENEGPGPTRNRALDLATGDFVVFLDSDDYLETDYFERLVQKIDEENADVVFIDVVYEKTNGDVLRFEKASNFRGLDRKTLIGCQTTGFLPWGGVRKAASRKLIEERRLRYSNQAAGEEAIFSFELLRHAKKIAFVEKTLYHYVDRVGSQSKLANDFPTLDNLKLHLEKEGIRDEYSDCLNAYAYVCLILWVLDAAKTTPLGKCAKVFKKKIREFEKEFGWELGARYLRKEARFLLPFVKMKATLLIVAAAKIVRR